MSIARPPLVLLAIGLAGCSLPHARRRANEPMTDASSATDGALDGMTDDGASPEEDVLARDGSDAGDGSDTGTAMDAADAGDALASDAGDAALVGDSGDASAAGDAGDAGDSAAPSDASDAGDAGPVVCEPGTFDCGDGRCRPVLGRVSTCREATVDGVFVLDVGGTPWCGHCRQMDEGARWTMVLKASGAESAGGAPQRFGYDSTLWTNEETFRPYEVERDTREMKARGMFVQPFRELLIEMTTGGTTRSLRGALAGAMAMPVSSLRAVFLGPPNAYGSLWSFDNFVGLVPDARLQWRCERAGINVRAPRDGNARVRIGAIANNDVLECDTHDSWVGVGGFNGDGNALSAGNIARDNWPNDRTIRSHATLWIR